MTREEAKLILEAGRNPYHTIDTVKWCEAFEMAIEALEQLTSYEQTINKLTKAISEQEPRWIPVSERLPETDGDVLVYDGVDMFVAWYSLKGMCQGWNSSDNNFERDTPIIAWMPLPKNPQESEE